MSWLLYPCIVLFILVCVFLILLVLIQKGRGGGLASAFGGMGGNTAFGAKTGDVLTWATSVVFGIFLLMAAILNLLTSNVHLVQRSVSVQAPVVPVAPTNPAGPENPATPGNTPGPAGGTR